MIPITTPQTISKLPVPGGVLFWLDATTTLLGIAPYWIDKSGSANTGTEATNSKRPTCIANQQGGQSAMSFNLKSMVLPSSAYTLSNGPNTIFVVSKRTIEDGSLGIIIDFSIANVTKLGLFYGASAGQVAFKNVSGGNAGCTKSGNTNTNYQIIKASFNGTTGCSVGVNNGSPATSTDGAVISGIDVACIGTIGENQFPMVGFIGEIIAYNRILSAAESLLMHQYLSTKWNIAIS